MSLYYANRQKLMPMNKQKHIKIFIADDHPVIIEGIQCALARHPRISIVGTATSGEALIKALPRSRPTILLLDLNMPGPDFLQNIDWVKREMSWVRIVVFSEYHTPELIKTLFQAGVKGYVAKQASLEELIEAIHTVEEGSTYVAPPAYPHSDTNGQSGQNALKDDFRKRLTLSRREQEILELISKGLSSQGIGKTLFISKHTVETHRKNILRKLDFNTSTELVKFAVQQGLV
ncbi:MAG TPA: response regulator transcription factor [Bacteroidetes bacterium]|nr:response regulator transcription factor [Bacteroidota bacterium]